MEKIPESIEDLNGKDILIGVSGGINSAAVVMWLIESGYKPKSVHLFYAHFKEHSPDTFPFVKDIIRYARQKLSNVHVSVVRNSVLDFFRKENIIPHPANSPCSKRLKIYPINNYAASNGIFIDLVGYVKHEVKRRGERQQKNMDRGLFSLDKLYPIGEFTDDWCFEIVKKHIGWYPAIYDILDSKGKRIFKHNNCLPCKNMYPHEIEAIKQYYPSYYDDAMQLSSDLKKYWGRDEAEFYSTFGRDLGQESTCSTCKW
jgi:hypothetical protein